VGAQAVLSAEADYDDVLDMTQPGLEGFDQPSANGAFAPRAALPPSGRSPLPSAAGSAPRKDAIADAAALRLRVMDELRGRFRPEFLNRLDELVIFHPLRKRQLLAIAELQLTALRGRLKARDITLRVPPAALAMLVDLGWSPEYGARPLKRTIQKELEAPLARALLSGEVGEGDEVEVLVNREDAKLMVRRVDTPRGDAQGEGAAGAERGVAGVA